MASRTLALALLGMLGCPTDPVSEPECTTAADCFRDDVCVNGFCIRPEDDGGVDPRDAGGGDSGRGDTGTGDAATDAPGDAAALDTSADATRPPGSQVDLLFVLDSSRSMQPIQQRVADAFPDLLRALATGRPDPDEPPAFEPFADLRAGIISVDLGDGTGELPSCTMAGDDAALLTRVGEECVESPDDRWLQYDATMLSRFRDDFGCRTLGVGVEGCGFEQQLEAMAMAVTPSGTSLRFFGDREGQADRSNDGFLRDDSVLAVLIVTDEDDCSAEDPALFEFDGYPSSLTTRCTDHPEALHRLSRYVDLLADAGRPVVYGVLAGIPSDLEGEAPAVILDDPRMTPRYDGAGMPVSVCESGEPSAGAAPRLVGVAAEVRAVARGPVTSVVGSLCRSDYGDFAARLRDAIVEVAGAPE